MTDEQTLNDILEIVRFTQDNMVTKSYLEERLSQTSDNLISRMVTKDHFETQLSQVKSDLMTHMDGFIGLHQKLDLEIVAMRARYDRLEAYIHQIAKQANIQLT